MQCRRLKIMFKPTWRVFIASCNHKIGVIGEYQVKDIPESIDYEGVRSISINPATYATTVYLDCKAIDKIINIKR